MLKKLFLGTNFNICFEPGRSLVADAGILVTKVIREKKTITKNFLIVDAGMNDFIRPTLYNTYHRIEPILKDISRKQFFYDIVGPICETGDTFATGIKLTNISEGDLVAINSAGAYGAVMSSFYNSRPLIAEVMVKDSNFEIVRKKLDISSLLNYESMPDWIKT